jgi:hypothetical protein
VCPLAATLLPKFAPFCVSSEGAPSTVSKTDFDALAQEFRDAEKKRVAGGSTIVSASGTDKEPLGSSAADGKASSTAATLWTDMEAWIHLVCTGHFHCGVLESIIYPKHLGSLLGEVLPRIRRAVWSARKSLLARVCVEWGDAGTQAIQQLITEAGSSVTIALTAPPDAQPTAATAAGEDAAAAAVRMIVPEEPATPILPTGKEAETALNTILDGFIDRYRELLAAAARLSRGGESVEQPSPSQKKPAAASAAASSNGAEQSNANRPKPCCGQCTRGLALALKRLVPETTDAQIVRTLQNRLRQKLVVAFALNDKDRAVVKALLAEVAAQVWRVAVGGDLAAFAEKSKKQSSIDKNDGDDDGSASPQQQQPVFSPTAADEQEPHGGGNASQSNGGGGDGDDDDGTAAKAAMLARDGEHLADERAAAAIAATVDKARSRVITHAAAEITRLTEAISELVVQRRCPNAHRAFVTNIVPRCANVVQPHLLLQAQALLTAKELARIAEKVCDSGAALGGIHAAGPLSRRDAAVVELGRSIEQVQSMLKRFPPSSLEKPATTTAAAAADSLSWWESDEEEDGAGGAASAGSGIGADDDDDFRRSDNSGGKNDKKGGEEGNDAFAHFGRVLPLYRIKTSVERYAEFVKQAE